MGPFELMDLIGLDTTYDCLINQARQMNRAPDFGAVLPQLVAEGKTGRKAQKGFFNYE
jgi:3-hydroxyacyl-CoA dehydrogenase